MARLTAANLIHLILEGVAILGILVNGLLLASWTSPHSQADIRDVALNNSNWYEVTVSNVIRNGTEGQYTVMFRTNALPNQTMLYRSTDRERYAQGPWWWTDQCSGQIQTINFQPFPNVCPSMTTFATRYVVFSYSFSGLCGPGIPNLCGPLWWFTGPRGNLSQAIPITKYGGTDVYHSGFFGTVLIAIDSPGNYTLHSFNNCQCNGNVSGTVEMGPSAVVFTRPYLYWGTATVVFGAAFATMTIYLTLVMIKKKPQAVVAQPNK